MIRLYAVGGMAKLGLARVLAAIKRDSPGGLLGGTLGVLGYIMLLTSLNYSAIQGLIFDLSYSRLT